MTRTNSLVFKDGEFESVPSLPPADRVTFLIDENNGSEFTPISTLYHNMGFPIGVYTRTYEELFYLDNLLCSESISHGIAKLESEYDVRKLAGGYNVFNEAVSHLNDQERIQRAALGIETTEEQYGGSFKSVTSHADYLASLLVENQEKIGSAALGDDVSSYAQKLLVEQDEERRKILGGSASEQLLNGNYDPISRFHLSEDNLAGGQWQREMVGNSSLLSHRESMFSDEIKRLDKMGTTAFQDSALSYAQQLSKEDNSSLNNPEGLLAKIRAKDNPYLGIRDELLSNVEPVKNDVKPFNFDFYTDNLQRQKKEQDDRDEAQKRSTDAIVKLLELDAKRFEEEEKEREKQEAERIEQKVERSEQKADRSQQRKDRTEQITDNRRNIRLTIYVAVITTATFVVNSIFEPQEIRGFIVAGFWAFINFLNFIYDVIADFIEI